jgi:hypothetical protein
MDSRDLFRVIPAALSEAIGLCYNTARLNISGEIIGAWCNGSTAVFGTVYPGSNPGAPA